MAFKAPGKLELAILDVLWEHGPAPAKEVLARLDGARKPAYSTVLTVLRRMKAKGMPGREKVSHSHVYHAVVDRESIRRQTVKDVLSRLFGDSPGELVAHLVEEQKITPQELKKVEALLRNRKKRS